MARYTSYIQIIFMCHVLFDTKWWRKIIIYCVSLGIKLGKIFCFFSCLGLFLNQLMGKILREHNFHKKIFFSVECPWLENEGMRFESNYITSSCCTGRHNKFYKFSLWNLLGILLRLLFLSCFIVICSGEIVWKVFYGTSWKWIEIWKNTWHWRLES